MNLHLTIRSKWKNGSIVAQIVIGTETMRGKFGATKAVE